jgi:type II secretory pathway component PulM
MLGIDSRERTMFRVVGAALLLVGIWYCDLKPAAPRLDVPLRRRAA